MSARRFVIRVLGYRGQLIGHRYVLSYQAIDRIAAVEVPQAEMLRLFGETAGNTVAVLAPMAEALKSKGYSTLMVLPAQTQVVELIEVAGGGSGDAPGDYAALFDDAHRLEVESARLLAECTETLVRAVTFLRGSKEPGSQQIVGQLTALAQRTAAAYVSKG